MNKKLKTNMLDSQKPANKICEGAIFIQNGYFYCTKDIAPKLNSENKWVFDKLCPFCKKTINEEISNVIPFKFQNALMRDVKNSLKEYYQDLLNGTGLYLWGGCGSGKTHSIYALFRKLRESGKAAEIINLSNLIYQLKSGFQDKLLNRENIELIERITKVKYLFIDDIGAEKPTEWIAETLYNLINNRYENNKTTILTSNFSLDELVQRLGDRVPSRIAEMCEIMELKGEDKRIKK